MSNNTCTPVTPVTGVQVLLLLYSCTNMYSRSLPGVCYVRLLTKV